MYVHEHGFAAAGKFGRENVQRRQEMRWEVGTSESTTENQQNQFLDCAVLKRHADTPDSLMPGLDTY